MDTVYHAKKNFESLGFKEGFKEEGSLTITSRLFGSSDESPNSYRVYASFDDRSGRYDFRLCNASLLEPQVKNIQEKLYTEYHSSEDSPRKQLEEFFENIVNNEKKEVGIPDDVDIGSVCTMFEFIPEIHVYGPNAHQAYELLKSRASKLGYLDF